MDKRGLLIAKLEEYITYLMKLIRLNNITYDISIGPRASFESEIAALKAEIESEKVKDDEFHVWVIPINNEIFVEDRGGGVPVGATEHIVFDTWEEALKLGQFLSKFCNYTLELDNEAGRFAEFESNNH